MLHHKVIPDTRVSEWLSADMEYAEPRKFITTFEVYFFWIR